MVKNYLKVALRSILKNKIFTVINIVGLSLGAAAFILIVQYVSFEKSFEDFLKAPNQLYRVTLDQYLNNELMLSSAENYPGVGPAMVEEIPGVESFARLYNMGYKNNVIITYEDAPDGPVAFKHRKFLYADSSFLPMFGYQIIKGDPESALSKPNQAVISETYAKMYFGEEDPIGKMLHLKDDDFNDELCKVTAVFKDLPDNTHLKFDLLFSYKTLFSRGEWAPARYDQSWSRKDMYTYVRLSETTSAEEVEARLPALINKYSPDLAERNRSDELALQAVEDIHLHSDLAEEPEPNGNADNVFAMMIIAGFIIIIAWVNYINLSTAKAMERANEVGVRKAMGAFKKQLMWQFLMESALVNLVSIVFSLFIVFLTLPVFNNISGLSFTFIEMLTPTLGLIVFGLWLIGTLLSGLYPAFVLSSFQPVLVLKGKLRSKGKGILLRKGLVIFQFIASVALIAGTLIIYNQLDYMQNKDIGMNVDQILVVERPGVAPRDRNEYRSVVDVFRNEIKKNSSIKAVAASITIPGKKREYKDAVKLYGASDDEAVTLRWNSMDYEFQQVFEMDVLAGRFFSEEFTSDPDTAVVLTKSAVELLGFKEPSAVIGQTLTISAFDWNPIVVGVVNDYNQESLQKAQDPIIFYCTAYGGEFYSMRVDTDGLSSTIEHVEQSWNAAFPGNPFNYFFLDDYFNRQYESEQRFGDLFGAFALLAIIVGCLGLFGLSAYTAQQRTKEIGVRKVLGSSEGQIFVLLSKSFIVLVTIAVLVAIPVTYYFMDNWLNSFAYKEPIPMMVFVIAGVSVLIISFITVSYQTFRAARINPVESLRHE